MKVLGIAALVVLGAASAHADISDSGNLTIGGQAVIAGTMTVQGGAFSVGATTFSVNAGTVSVSSVLKASQGILWADGSTSTTAVASASPLTMLVNSTDTVSGLKTFVGNVKMSTHAFVTLTGASYSTTQTTLSSCVTGSTVTITIVGSTVAVVSAGYAANTAESLVAASFLMDGGYASGLGGTAAITSGTAGSTQASNISFTWIQGGLSPGTHSFCLVIAGSGATIKLDQATAIGTGATRFGAYEFH